MAYSIPTGQRYANALLQQVRSPAGSVAGDYPGPRYSKEELMGSNLQSLIDNAEGDDDLSDIAHSLRFHGMSVPSVLGQ